MSTEKTRQLAENAIKKCLPEGDRLSNAIKDLIDRVMRGDIFENASALNIARWILCADGIKTALDNIPDWNFNGEIAFAGQTVTPQQEYFYTRILSLDVSSYNTANEGFGTDLLNRLRTLQYGAIESFSIAAPPTLSQTITNQQTQLNKFKKHTDNQTGTGDPNTFMRNMSIASSYDMAKQQMEGKRSDNFTSMFNSSIQGPGITKTLLDLFCGRGTLTDILRSILDLIASGLPFSLDDILALLGGSSLDEFFNALNALFATVGELVSYLGLLISLDFSRYNFARAYLAKYTLGQYLAAMVRGDGRGNCFQRAIMEEFLGSDNLRSAIGKIDFEKQEEERKKNQPAQATTKIGKEKATKQADTTPKELFFAPASEEQIMQGVNTGSDLAFDENGDPIVEGSNQALIEEEMISILAQIEGRLDLLEARTYQVGYKLATLPEAVPPHEHPHEHELDGGQVIDF